MRHSRSCAGSVIRGLGVSLLAAILVVIMGWAVIGKYRFDPEARAVYKATRLIVSTRIAVPVPALACLGAIAFIPPPAPPSLASLPVRCRVELPPRRYGVRCSRAPPIS